MRIEHTKDGITASQPGLKSVLATRPDPSPLQFTYMLPNIVTKNTKFLQAFITFLNNCPGKIPGNKFSAIPTH